MRLFPCLVLGLFIIGCAEPGEESTSGSPALQLNDNGNTVLVGDEWKACERVSDCIEVGTSCDGCCGREAINVSLQEPYGQEQAMLCADYEGGVCDCAPPEVTMMCIDQLCTLVET
jgi:hypothetical protein